MGLLPSLTWFEHRLSQGCCISALIRPRLAIDSRAPIWPIGPLRRRWRWRRRLIPTRRSPATWSWARRVAVYVRRRGPSIVHRFRVPWLRGRSIVSSIARCVGASSGCRVIDVMRRICGGRAGWGSIPIVVICGSLGAPQRQYEMVRGETNH